MNKSLTRKSRNNTSLFIFANTISYLGDLVFLMVINLWVVRVSGDASVLGLVSAISAIGLLIGNPIGGYLSDKLNKKSLLIISDSFSAIAVLFLYLIYLHISEHSDQLFRDYPITHFGL
ncbi:MFS transporter, partial [Vibrio zhanjiangensis]|uniref:MFS transporter n=1 Tax=Vibrio zhanjiangensis TaxID=1046128 RepID=UPI0024E04789